MFGKQLRRVALIAGDIGEEATAKRAVTATIERFGQLDGVVSNAGIMIRKPIRQLTLAEWRRVLDVNLTAAFLLAKAAERPLRQTNGAFVSIASTRAAMSEPDTEAYSATQGRAGGAHPCAGDEPCAGAGELRQPRLDRDARTTTSCAARITPSIPSAASAGREDIAEIVAWLLDGERSGFVTGANFTVDGGMTRKMIYVE